jgi:hypothetical protein
MLILINLHLEKNRSKQLNKDVLSGLPIREIAQTSISLPANFPNVISPRYKEGQSIRWISDSQPSDWGTVIGRFFNYAPHLKEWSWCYLIWLDKNSTSAAWVVADTAWEDDLKLVEEEVS